jgi:hypothetical protein
VRDVVLVNEMKTGGSRVEQRDGLAAADAIDEPDDRSPVRDVRAPDVAEPQEQAGDPA